MPNTAAKPSRLIHVAVGVIVQQGSVLLAKRASHQHQGGLWEFPGGKVEANEQVIDALIRELHEELAITPTHFQPLIQIHHDYGDKRVLLDVWTVTSFSGQPHGQEGQPLEWVPVAKLSNYSFPAANQAIVKALSLPNLVAITPSVGDKQSVLAFCKNAIAAGATAIQLRVPQLAANEVGLLYRDIKALAGLQHLWLNSRHLYDSDTQRWNRDFIAAIKGVHFCSHHLSIAAPLFAEGVFAHCTITAACHNAAELKQAEELGADAALLSPVLPTQTHIGAPSLGWNDAAHLVFTAKLPVFLLGGLALDDLSMAKSYYAQGLAGISMFCS